VTNESLVPVQNIDITRPLQVGDVVRLKSGGQTMAVADVRGDKNVECVWMRPDGRIERGVFSALSLSLVQMAVVRVKK
jgi:uncharacterized protein YodC (DUF2158 family)